MLSDQKQADDWGYGIKPTVYLSAATALTNVFLSYALAEGVVISFWRRAKNRSTLQDLHQYWLSRNSLLGALKGTLPRTAMVAGCACIMTTVSIARGPLLQQAPSVRNALFSTQDTMEVHVAKQLPQQYTSIPQLSCVTTAESVAYLTSKFTTAQLLDQVGSKGVRYGEIRQPSDGLENTVVTDRLRWRKLVICEASLASKPGTGTVFYYHNEICGE